jgi:hypothetical protein
MGDIEKHKVTLLDIDSGASISAIPFSLGPRSSKKLLFGAYQTNPQSIISISFQPASGEIPTSVTPFYSSQKSLLLF